MRYHLLRALVVDQLLVPEPKPRRKRRTWVWPYLQKRLRYGHYDTLMDELYKDNPHLYKNYIRMDRELFDRIVEAVTPVIERKTSRWRKPINPGTRGCHHPPLPCHRGLIQIPTICISCGK